MWFISCGALNSSVIEILQKFYENISIGQCFLFIEEIFSYPKNLSKLNLKKKLSQLGLPNSAQNSGWARLAVGLLQAQC